MLKYTFAILALIALASCSDVRDQIMDSFMDKPTKDAFKVYRLIYNKEYELNSEEGVRRYRIFKTNLKEIKETNAKDLPYKFGVNEFTDLSDEEFADKYLLKEDFEKSLDKMVKNLRDEGYFDRNADEDDNKIASVMAFETSVDWTSNYGPARNQGGCGSCWAFSSLGMVEGRIAQKTGTITPYLSAQELVDCAPSCGCRGGSWSSALNYIIKNGIINDSEYPYTATKAPTCNASTINTPRTYIKSTKFDYCGGTNLNKCNEDSVFTRLLDGPLAVSIDGCRIKSMKSGIFTGACTGGCPHAVVLVGAGRDSTTGLEYWTIRNSWGANWGNNGIINVARNVTNSNNCFITQNAYSITP